MWFQFSNLQPQEKDWYSLARIQPVWRHVCDIAVDPSHVKRSYFIGALGPSAGRPRVLNTTLMPRRLESAIRPGLCRTPAAAHYQREAKGDKAQMQCGFSAPTSARHWLPDLFRCHKFTDCWRVDRGKQKELILALALSRPCRRRVRFN